MDTTQTLFTTVVSKLSIMSQFIPVIACLRTKSSFLPCVVMIREKIWYDKMAFIKKGLVPLTSRFLSIRNAGIFEAKNS